MMNRTQYLLIKLAEEAAEVAQIALKSSQFGLTEKNPDMLETNAERIYAELDDLAAIVAMLRGENSDFNYVPNAVRQELKRGKVQYYAAYSVRLGMLDAGSFGSRTKERAET